jgi:hypothetical protein
MSFGTLSPWLVVGGPPVMEAVSAGAERPRSPGREVEEAEDDGVVQRPSLRPSLRPPGRHLLFDPARIPVG